MLWLVAKCRVHRVPAFKLTKAERDSMVADGRAIMGEIVTGVHDDGDLYYIAEHRCEVATSKRLLRHLSQSGPSPDRRRS